MRGRGRKREEGRRGRRGEDDIIISGKEISALKIARQRLTALGKRREGRREGKGKKGGRGKEEITLGNKKTIVQVIGFKGLTGRKGWVKG